MKYHLPTFVTSTLVAAAAAAMTVAGMAASPGPVSGSVPIPVAELLVVDCLLPGQVRQLGTRSTYVAARRPAKLTGRDCAIRGGEYVAADRASASTSLAVWRAAADAGDPEAATIVGEIFERGMAGKPDFESAQQWYRVAAERGSARAKVNLGHLYEKGLGVTPDRREALRWYRSAAGADVPLALDPGEPDGAAALQADTQELQRLREQVSRLSAELAVGRSTPPVPVAPPPPIATPAPIVTDEAAEARALAAVLESEVRELRTQLRSQLAAAETQLSAARALEAQRARELESSGAELNLVQRSAQQGQRRIAELEVALQERERRSNEHGLEVAQMQAQVSRLQSSLEAAEREAQRRLSAAAAGSTPPVSLAGPEITVIDPPVTATRGIVVVPSIAVVAGSSRTIVGRIVAPAGLLRASLNETDLSVNNYGVFAAPLPTVSGDSRVSIVAIDRQGQRAAVDFELRAPAPAPPGPEPGKSEAARRLAAERVALGSARYYALIIGNNDYAKLPDLKTAADDARALDELLRKRYGFETTLLTNATRYDILAALNALRERLTTEDRLLVYYAGHGELDTLNSRSYWLPVDAEPDSNANWIASVAVTDLLNIIRAQHILLVVDSCYSGALTRSSIARLGTAMTINERLNWLRKIGTKRSRTVLTSGGLEPVLDSGGVQHSVFAQALLDVLESNGDVMDGQGLFREVAARVSYAAERIGFNQVPEYAPIRFAGHEGGEFHFVPAPAGG